MEGSPIFPLCGPRCGLEDAELAEVEQIAAVMPLISRLVNADIFLDCFVQDDPGALVVAEARQPGATLYEHSVVGKPVEPEKEPAVFSARETGMPVRDILAVTQESRTVRQVVIPLKGGDGHVYGVLIQEKDISESVTRDKKYAELEQITERQRLQLHKLQDEKTAYMPSVNENELALREIHHRVKNNLQMVASMLGLQARASAVPETRQTLRENVSRILGIAAIYDLLSLDAPGQAIDLGQLLQKVCRNVAASTGCGERGIRLRVEGGSVPVDSEQAATVALVVNELVMNAVEHAFEGRDGGEVIVTGKPGHKLTAVTVCDNGSGLPNEAACAPGLGLNLVRSLVAEKLRGTLQTESGGGGSCFFFDFMNGEYAPDNT